MPDIPMLYTVWDHCRETARSREQEYRKKATAVNGDASRQAREREIGAFATLVEAIRPTQTRKEAPDRLLVCSSNLTAVSVELCKTCDSLNDHVCPGPVVYRRVYDVADVNEGGEARAAGEMAE